MRLVKTYDYSRRGPRREYDIATATESECYSDADGAVERAGYVANAAAKKLGDLLALLHERSVLTDDDVLSLLSGFKKIS